MPAMLDAAAHTVARGSRLPAAKQSCAHLQLREDILGVEKSKPASALSNHMPTLLLTLCVPEKQLEDALLLRLLKLRASIRADRSNDLPAELA